MAVSPVNEINDPAFDPEPVLPGPALDRDIAIYLWLCSEAGLPPSRWMLPLFADEFATALFRRRGTAEVWEMFQAAVDQRHPSSQLRSDAAEAAVSAIPMTYKSSVRLTRPEIFTGWLLLIHLPVSVNLARNVPLPGEIGGNARRADFTLSRQVGGAPVYLEVCGMLDSNGEARTAAGVQYRARQAKRREAYQAVGVSPVTVFGGELLSEARRVAVVKRVLAALDNAA